MSAIGWATVTEVTCHFFIQMTSRWRNSNIAANTFESYWSTNPTLQYYNFAEDTNTILSKIM